MKHKFKESRVQKSVSFRLITLNQLEEIRIATKTELTDNEILAAAVADYHKKCTEIPLILCQVCGAQYSKIIGHCPRCAANAPKNADDLLDAALDGEPAD